MRRIDHAEQNKRKRGNGSRSDATSEVVGDTGVLVAPGDLDAATQVCVELLGRGARRAALAAAARERVESQFRVERAAREGADALAAGLGFA